MNSSGSRLLRFDAATYFSCALSLLSACGKNGDAASSSTSGGGGASTSANGPTTSTSGGPASTTGITTTSTTSAGGSGGAMNGCPTNTTLVKTVAACSGAAPSTPAALATSLGAGSRGDVVDMAGLDVAGLPCRGVLVCRPNDAATLIFSDEPETTSTDGIVYADVLAPGRYRVYVYHVNAASAARKFPVVVLNQGADAATVTITRKGLAGPNTDYVGVGKAAVHDWLLDNRATTVSVPAGQRVLLDTDLDALHAGKDQLVHAIIDFSSDRTLKLSVVSVPAAADAAVLTAGLSVIPNSGLHARGTFPGAEYVIVSDSTPLEGVRAVSLGENLVDPDLPGQSFVDGGVAETLLGNFGVPYDIVFPFAGHGALAISPRGGGWGGAAILSDGEDTSAGIVDLPSAQTTLDVATSAIHTGRYASGATASGTIMTAGGSSLPISLLVAPLPN